MTDAERNDNFNLRMAIDEAARRAQRTATSMRIFRAYNAYCIRPATADYAGTSVGIVTASGLYKSA